MSLLRFWVECFLRIIKSAIGAAGAVALFVFLTGRLIVYCFPVIGDRVDFWMWAIPGAVFIVALIIGLIWAPHSMYKEVEQKRNEFQIKLNQKAQKIETQNEIGSFLEEARLLSQSYEKQQPPNVKDVRAWIHKVDTYLYANLGGSYGARFRDEACFSAPPTTIRFQSASDRNVWSTVQIKRACLRQFLEELIRE
jgi:hypothetical protein